MLSGPVTFGYKKIGKGRDAYLEIEEFEAHIVKQIFNMYVHGNGDGSPMTLRQITAKFNDPENPIPTPRYKKKTAKHWYPESSRRILANETYIGKMYYGKTRNINGKQVDMPRDEWIEIDVPELQIIDKDTFEAVNKRSKRNSWRSPRNRKHKYLLASHIRCGACGYAMYGTTKRPNTDRPIKYYRCTSSNTTYRDCEVQNRNIPTAIVDEYVWNWLLNFLMDDRKLDEGLDRLVEKREHELEPKMRDLQNLNELVEEAEAKITWLVDEMTNHNHEAVVKSMRDKIGEIANQPDALVKERERVLVEVSQVNIPENVREQVHDLARKVRERIPDASFENKRWLLDMLKVAVTTHINGDDFRIELDWMMPTKHEGELSNVLSQEDDCL